MNPDTLFRRTANQVSCDLSGEAAILNLNTGMYYGLDSVGAKVWDLIQLPSTLATIRDAIVEQYNVTAEQCEADLLMLFADLQREGLVEVYADPVR